MMDIPDELIISVEVIPLSHCDCPCDILQLRLIPVSHRNIACFYADVDMCWQAMDRWTSVSLWRRSRGCDVRTLPVEMGHFLICWPLESVPCERCHWPASRVRGDERPDLETGLLLNF